MSRLRIRHVIRLQNVAQTLSALVLARARVRFVLVRIGVVVTHEHLPLGHGDAHLYSEEPRAQPRIPLVLRGNGHRVSVGCVGLHRCDPRVVSVDTTAGAMAQSALDQHC